jgi:hypothetical protein
MKVTIREIEKIVEDYFFSIDITGIIIKLNKTCLRFSTLILNYSNEKVFRSIGS